MFCMLPKTEAKQKSATLLYHMEEWILRGLLLVLLFCYFVSRESWLRSNSALYLHLSPFLLYFICSRRCNSQTVRLRVRVQLSARADTFLGWDAWSHPVIRGPGFEPSYVQFGVTNGIYLKVSKSESLKNNRPSISLCGFLIDKTW